MVDLIFSLHSSKKRQLCNSKVPAFSTFCIIRKKWKQSMVGKSSHSALEGERRMKLEGLEQPQRNRWGCRQDRYKRDQRNVEEERGWRSSRGWKSKKFYQYSFKIELWREEEEEFFFVVLLSFSSWAMSGVFCCTMLYCETELNL